MSTTITLGVIGWMYVAQLYQWGANVSIDWWDVCFCCLLFGFLYYLLDLACGMQNRPLKSGSTDMQNLGVFGEPDSLDVGAYLGNDVISV